jgi:hypothetical protein
MRWRLLGDGRLDHGTQLGRVGAAHTAKSTRSHQSLQNNIWYTSAESMVALLIALQV